MASKKGITKRRWDTLGLKAIRPIIDNIEETTLARLRRHYDNDELDFSLQASHNLEFGDYSTTALLKNSKRHQIDMDELDSVLTEILKENEHITEVSTAPNKFINIRLSDQALLQIAQSLNSQENQIAQLGHIKSILIESPSVNPNKALHVGHLLNVLVAGSLNRILRATGIRTERDEIINDLGVPVCMTIWAIRNLTNGETLESSGLKPDQFVGKYYVLGKNAFKEDQEVEKAVRQIMVDLESCDEQTVKDWKSMIEMSIAGQIQTYNSYGEDGTWHRWYESDIYKDGKDIVIEQLEKGTVRKDETGALLSDINEEYGVRDAVLLRPDGTTLYHTQDIKLAKNKLEKYNVDMMMYVVDEEQIDHFQSLFSILDAFGIKELGTMYHFAYAKVLGGDGKSIKSRDGVDLTADQLLVEIQDRIRASSKEKGQDIDEASITKIALTALKYLYLSRDPFKAFRFDTLDLDEAVSFKGKSGTYCLYSYTRAKSLIAKFTEEFDGSISDSSALLDIERLLLLQNAKYNEVVTNAADTFTPSEIASYVYDLSKLFNRYYEEVKFSELEKAKLKTSLTIVSMVSETIKKSLELLGVEVVERM